ncbi:unnamed protein product [Durusdinium trenchii]|uniref:Uncharacterized protein n=1 Tax=Durusdinium trenchii TaxID=1381693 RepID=A0ABP0KEJ6_9DINO
MLFTEPPLVVHREAATEKAVTKASRQHDFIFCANIVGTLGNAIQALQAFLIIADRLQARGWRVLVLLPAVGLHEYDREPLPEYANGTGWEELFDLTPLKKILDIEEVTDTVAERRRVTCWEESCEISVWSMAQVRVQDLREVQVPHVWMGPGKEEWMFSQLYDNLESLAGSTYAAPIRVFWQMQRFSPTRCAPFVYPEAAQRISEHLQPKLVASDSGIQKQCGQWSAWVASTVKEVDPNLISSSALARAGRTNAARFAELPSDTTFTIIGTNVSQSLQNTGILSASNALNLSSLRAVFQDIVYVIDRDGSAACTCGIFALHGGCDHATFADSLQIRARPPKLDLNQLPATTRQKGRKRKAEPPTSTQEPCAFVYVSHILRRDGLWPLQSASGWFTQPIQAAIGRVAVAIGELLEEQQISCANFYVKLLGLSGQDFVELVEQGAREGKVGFVAKRLKKRNCKLCMAGNMEILQRASYAPLLVAEPDTFWPDLPASRLLAQEKPVAYLYGEVLSKRRWDAELEKYVEPVPNITLRRLNCSTPQVGWVMRVECSFLFWRHTDVGLCLSEVM